MKKTFLLNSLHNLDDIEAGSLQPLHVHFINLVNVLL